MAMFRAAIDEDRVTSIDYGTGDEPYKADWMTERGTLWRIEAFSSRSLFGVGRATRHLASGLVRRSARR
jgi:CelD/BcsL family acetyltransferase involved in cellulose biosynthesis